jgi:hypothetical protein
VMAFESEFLGALFIFHHPHHRVCLNRESFHLPIFCFLQNLLGMYIDFNFKRDNP